MKIIRDLKKEILSGKIFIYPTDTIYGIGCNAENIDSVEKIKEIKSRDKDKPLSVIAPSTKWIEDHLILDLDIRRYLPGPYTLILKKKDPKFLSHVSSRDTLGVRIPDNDFTKDIQGSGVPFITTSVNLAGEPFISEINQIKTEIKSKVDFVIDIGPLTGKPSTIVMNGVEIKR